MTTSTVTSGTESAVSAHHRSVLVTALLGLAGVAVLLQGLWAGLFLEHDGQRDAAGSWIDVHARGGEVALVLAIAATIIAFVKVRTRRDLWAGGLVLAGLLIAESYVGGLIRDDSKDTLTAVHVPLAMAVMGVAAWVFGRSLRGR
jgi:hypothetical protein